MRGGRRTQSGQTAHVPRQLGFARAITPPLGEAGRASGEAAGIATTGIAHLGELVSMFGPARTQKVWDQPEREAL